MKAKLATKEYVDSKIRYIQTYQPFDGRTIQNEFFEKASMIIVSCKKDDNLSKSFCFDTRLATYVVDEVLITFSIGKSFILGSAPNWYVTGFICIK